MSFVCFLSNFGIETNNTTITMGSTGSGNFSDYSKRPPKSANDKSGGGSGEDQCLRAFSTDLEDIESCEYFVRNNNVPPVGTEVTVVLDKRLCVQDLKGVVIGYLPTRYNYLAGCMDEGHSYSGRVSESGLGVLAYVRVDIHPS